MTGCASNPVRCCTYNLQPIPNTELAPFFRVDPRRVTSRPPALSGTRVETLEILWFNMRGGSASVSNGRAPGQILRRDPRSHWRRRLPRKVERDWETLFPYLVLLNFQRAEYQDQIDVLGRLDRCWNVKAVGQIADMANAFEGNCYPRIMSYLHLQIPPSLSCESGTGSTR